MKGGDKIVIGEAGKALTNHQDGPRVGGNSRLGSFFLYRTPHPPTSIKSFKGGRGAGIGVRGWRGGRGRAHVLRAIAVKR